MKKRGRKEMPDALRKKRQVSVRLLDDQLEALDKIAEREGLSISYFLREAIGLVIQKHSQPKESRRKKSYGS